MDTLDSALSKTVVVFDLDDTLYKEVDYQKSGFLEVARWIEETYGRSVSSTLVQLQKQGEKDILMGLCRAAGLPVSAVQSLMWIYRLHKPHINLNQDVRHVLTKLEKDCCGVAILTDGRSITQRLKLQALGLSHLPVYISEEFGDEKPSPKRFKAIMKEILANQYIYIADNPAKDFIAPNVLGWLTIGLRGTTKNIYPQCEIGLYPKKKPSIWINQLSELFELNK